MKRIGVSQRVVIDAAHGERRDALDQRWMGLLESAGLLPVLLPNVLKDIEGYCRTLAVEGLLLTGGNDLARLGTVAAALERDAVETAALDYAMSRRLPVLGVCRGMQFVVNRLGGTLREVAGHAGTVHGLIDEGGQLGELPAIVSSCHRWGCARENLPSSLRPAAMSKDGVVEAVVHASLPVIGVMWHPERESGAREYGSRLLERVFHSVG